MSIEDTAKKIMSEAEIFYLAETGESLKYDRRIYALIYAIAKVFEEQEPFPLLPHQRQ
jgi:hypothetical protein